MFGALTSPRQFPGLGPGTLLPFTANKNFLSELTLTLFGYQPVGINPLNLPEPAVPIVTTAMALRPPSLTKSVRSSGDKARLLGFAPFGSRLFWAIEAGAQTLKVDRTCLV